MSLAKTAALSVRTYTSSPTGIRFSAARKAFDRKGTKPEQHERHLKRIGKQELSGDSHSMGEVANLFGDSTSNKLMSDRQFGKKTRLLKAKGPAAGALKESLTRSSRRYSMSPGANTDTAQSALATSAALNEGSRNKKVRTVEARWKK